MTVDGGVLLYGLGGDDPTRPDTLMPFDLSGVAERIDQVAQAAISEPPTIEIHDIGSTSSPGTGYLVVVIPASPRAPHMVTLEGENRYYGRGATGNRILTEGEVARLYARREQWEIDRGSLLANVIAAIPFKFEEPPKQIGPMVVVARPVASSKELLGRARGDMDADHFLQRNFSERARELDPYPDQGTPGLGDAFDVARRGSTTWILQRDRDLTLPYQARLELTASGQFTYWHAPTINSRARSGDPRLLLMERSVTRAVFQTLATAAWLYEQGGYAGAVDIAVAVLNIEDAEGAALSSGFGNSPPYGAVDYRNDARVTTSELRLNAERLTSDLLAGLFDVISPRNYDPFAERRT